MIEYPIHLRPQRLILLHGKIPFCLSPASTLPCVNIAGVFVDREVSLADSPEDPLDLFPENMVLVVNQIPKMVRVPAFRCTAKDDHSLRNDDSPLVKVRMHGLFKKEYSDLI